MGPFKVHLKLVSHELAYEVSEQQGSFHSKPPMTIVLDENIMAMENESTLNVLIHELFHLCHYQYELEKDNRRRKYCERLRKLYNRTINQK